MLKLVFHGQSWVVVKVECLDVISIIPISISGD